MSLVIGLAGGSGSGKTTVVKRAALNYDHPDSLETGLMVRHVEALKAGQGIDAPVYDFTRHARSATTERIEPRMALIVEGILVLADKRLRDLMDSPASTANAR